LRGLIFLCLFASISVYAQSWFTQDNKDWGTTLRPLQEQLNKNKNFLLVIAFTPAQPFDMRSADHLRGSMEYSNWSLAISHIAIGWQCHNDQGQVYRYITGQSGEHEDQTKHMVLSGWGLTPFLSVFTDGNLETPAEFDAKRMPKYIRNQSGPPANKNELDQQFFPMVVELSQQECSDMVHFFHDYSTLPQKPYKNFGLVVDPEKFEGGGCGSFAVAMIRASHVMNMLLPDLKRTLQTSWRMLGYHWVLPRFTHPYHPPDYKQNRWVSLHDFMSSSWDDPSGTGPQISIIDPEMIFFMMRTFSEIYVDEYSGSNFPVMKRVASRYAPINVQSDGQFQTESIVHQEIDRKFDWQTESMFLRVHDWWQMKKSQDFLIREVDLLSRRGLVIERSEISPRL
jgi:hypothetical protein